eukprot:12899310-Prorocentrum_lima.AAC.1
MLEMTRIKVYALFTLIHGKDSSSNKGNSAHPYVSGFCTSGDGNQGQPGPHDDCNVQGVHEHVGEVLRKFE